MDQLARIDLERTLRVDVLCVSPRKGAIDAVDNSQYLNTPRAIVSIAISVVLGVLPVFLYYVATSQTDDDWLFFEGVFFWYLGLVFIFSARYAKQVYLLHLIDYVFTNFAVVGGKYRTLIYGTGFCIVAVIVHYRWLAAG